MKPKFKIESCDRVYLGEKYVSNGHWLLTREACRRAPRELKVLTTLDAFKEGRYEDGLKGYLNDTRMPNLEQVIPKRDGFVLLDPIVCETEVSLDDEVKAYVFKCAEKSFYIGIQPKYVPLARLGHIFAKHANRPILVLDGPTLNDNLVGVIMPIRLKRNEDKKP